MTSGLKPLYWDSGTQTYREMDPATDTLDAALVPGGGGGGGDVIGPGATVTDNALVRFDGTGGATVQESPVTVNDSGAVAGVASLDVTGNITVGGMVDGVDVATLSSTVSAHVAAAAPHADHAVGVASVTDNAMVRFDGTGGKQLQTSALVIDDNADATGLRDVALRNLAPTGTVDGRDIASDGADLDIIRDIDVPTAQETYQSIGTYVPDDFTEARVLWQVGPNRWRAGVSTAGFACPLFYAENNGGTFGNGGTAELHCVVGFPNQGSPTLNAPSQSQFGVLSLSPYNDEGITIPPGAFIQGAHLVITLTGFVKVGATRDILFILDPDGDVRVKTTGNNAVTWAERQAVLGAVPNSSIGTSATISDDGGGDCLFTYTAHALGDDQPVYLNNALAYDENYGDGLIPDIANDEGQELYVVVNLPRTGVTSESGTKKLTDPKFASLGVGDFVSVTNAGTSGLALGDYTVQSKPAADTVVLDLPGNATATVSDVEVTMAGDDIFWVSRVDSGDPSWPDLPLYNPTGGGAQESSEVLVTVNVGNGSKSRVVFGYEHSTVTADWIPFKFVAVGVADGSGINDTENGVTWYADYKVYPCADQIGTSALYTVATEGAPAQQWEPRSAIRTRPGTGVAGSAQPSSAAPLLRGKTNYDGAGTHAYVPTWHDYGGKWSEIELATTISTTGSQVMRSYLDDYTLVTVTMVEVGGEVIGEVLAYYPERRILRIRDLSNTVRVQQGDTVTLKLYRKISGTWNTTPHTTTSFTAGAVRCGPHDTKLSVRVCVTGAQDGTTQIDVRNGMAVLYRRRSN